MEAAHRRPLPEGQPFVVNGIDLVPQAYPGPLAGEQQCFPFGGVICNRYRSLAKVCDKINSVGNSPWVLDLGKLNERGRTGPSVALKNGGDRPE